MGLFHILQKSLHPNYYDPNRHIISMTFDKRLHYPKTVYISNDLHELGWNIKCLSMYGDDDDCVNNKVYPFWIEKRWQEIIGWFMLGLVVLMSCIGHFIAYLKKRARRKHRQYVRSQIKPNRGNANNNNQNKKKRRSIVSNLNNGQVRNRKVRKNNRMDVEEEEKEEMKQGG